MNKTGCKILLALLSTGAYAHHSTLGFYDPDEIIEIEGTVKSVSLKPRTAKPPSGRRGNEWRVPRTAGRGVVTSKRDN